MAEPAAFPESNLTLLGSPEDRAAGTVIDLHAFRFRDLDGQARIITAWRLSPAELAEVARTGIVWVDAWGETQPPMSLAGFSPFETPGERP